MGACLRSAGIARDVFVTVVEVRSLRVVNLPGGCVVLKVLLDVVSRQRSFRIREGRNEITGCVIALQRSLNHASRFFRTFPCTRRSSPKIPCEIAFTAKNPQEVASRWEPAGSFRPEKLNFFPERADNHHNRALTITSGFGIEFPIESAIKLLPSVETLVTQKHTIDDIPVK